MDILTINQFRVHELGQLLKGKPLLEAARQSFRLTAHVSCGNPGLIPSGAIGSRYPGNLGKAQRSTIPQASYVNTYIHIYMYTFIHIYIYNHLYIYTYIHVFTIYSQSLVLFPSWATDFHIAELGDWTMVGDLGHHGWSPYVPMVNRF